MPAAEIISLPRFADGVTAGISWPGGLTPFDQLLKRLDEFEALESKLAELKVELINLDAKIQATGAEDAIADAVKILDGDKSIQPANTELRTLERRAAAVRLAIQELSRRIEKMRDELVAENGRRSTRLESGAFAAIRKR